MQYEKIKILSKSVDIERIIPTNNNFIKRFLKISLPEIKLTVTLMLSNNTTLKSTTVLKGYRNMKNVQEALSILEDNVLTIHDSLSASKAFNEASVKKPVENNKRPPLPGKK